MIQNIYDDPQFFEAYSQLPRSLHGLPAMPEWPALQAMLPTLVGRRVLDLGCGFGWFARWARLSGAVRVLAVDASQRMLARAREQTSDEDIVYEHADLEVYEYPSAQFDVVYSALAFHYLTDLESVLRGAARALLPGGVLVFSVEHPLFTAPKNPGWIMHADGHRTWPVDSYSDEGPRTTSWLSGGVIKQHRTVSSYLNLLSDAGFKLWQIKEWSPSEAQVSEHPDWADERQRPPFLLIACTR
jgi:SAM-dependent methyltransferase